MARVGVMGTRSFVCVRGVTFAVRAYEHCVARGGIICCRRVKIVRMQARIVLSFQYLGAACAAAYIKKFYS